MNKKILLSLLAILLCTFSVNTDAATYKKQIFPVNVPDAVPVEKPQNRNTGHHIEWMIPVAAETSSHHDHNKHQETFNYDRVGRKRHHFFWVMVVKLLLILLHACTLVGATLHLAHVS